jgi:hypothetical protein
LLQSPAVRKPESAVLTDQEWISQVKKSNYDLHNLPWSAEVKGIDNALLSNTQKMDVNLQPNWFVDAEGNEVATTTLCLAVRSRVKKEASDLARLALAGANKFALVVTLEEIPSSKMEPTGQLYDELEALNEVTAIAELNAEGEINLEL